ARLAGGKSHRKELLPGRLLVQTDLTMPPAAQDKVPALRREVAHQANLSEGAVAEDDHRLFGRDQRTDLLQKRLLGFNRDAAFAAAVHTPGQRQRPATV